MLNYYPWNTKALSDWLKSEISLGKDISYLSQTLSIPERTLKEWLASSSSCSWSIITLEQIQLIAFYRDWSLDRVLRWLDICSAHLKELEEPLKDGR